MSSAAAHVPCLWITTPNKPHGSSRAAVANVFSTCNSENARNGLSRRWRLPAAPSVRSDPGWKKKKKKQKKTKKNKKKKTKTPKNNQECRPHDGTPVLPGRSLLCASRVPNHTIRSVALNPTVDPKMRAGYPYPRARPPGMGAWCSWVENRSSRIACCQGDQQSPWLKIQPERPGATKIAPQPEPKRYFILQL